jgi:hypothetical protein
MNIDYIKIANSVINSYDFSTGPDVSNIGTIDDFIIRSIKEEYGSEAVSRDTIVDICNEIRAEITKIQTN